MECFFSFDASVLLDLYDWPVGTLDERYLIAVYRAQTAFTHLLIVDVCEA